MKQKQKKFYVVWQGRRTGVFDSWAICKTLVDGFKGAKFKSYPNKHQAELAFAGAPFRIQKKPPATRSVRSQMNAYIEYPCIVVDGAYSSKRHEMEWQAITMPDERMILETDICPGGTNNIAEFLGIVDALKHCHDYGIGCPIYSDRTTARAWVRNKRAKTRLEHIPENVDVLTRLQEAEEWLKNNSYPNRILNWDTKNFGENPADYGRK